MMMYDVDVCSLSQETGLRAVFWCWRGTPISAEAPARPPLLKTALRRRNFSAPVKPWRLDLSTGKKFSWNGQVLLVDRSSSLRILRNMLMTHTYLGGGWGPRLIWGIPTSLPELCTSSVNLWRPSGAHPSLSRTCKTLQLCQLSRVWGQHFTQSKPPTVEELGGQRNKSHG